MMYTVQFDLISLRCFEYNLVYNIRGFVAYIIGSYRNLVLIYDAVDEAIQRNGMATGTVKSLI